MSLTRTDRPAALNQATHERPTTTNRKIFLIVC